MLGAARPTLLGNDSRRAVVAELEALAPNGECQPSGASATVSNVLEDRARAELTPHHDPGTDVYQHTNPPHPPAVGR